MANPGVGTKFVSVNLNKSYGQQHAQNHHHHHHNGSNSFYGISAGSRARGVSNSSSYGGGSGGSGGMVVLSRPRSSQKAGPKLSVPPPLNLPSLRKEHERFDSLGSGSGAGASGISGSGMRPGSSGMGWTKPASGGGLQPKDKEVSGIGDKGVVDGDLMHVGARGMDLGVKAGSVYMPPSARSGGGPIMPGYPPVVEKATVLRGEDFPSLRAAIPVGTNAPQKPKDGLSKKQDQSVDEDGGNNEGTVSMHSSALVDMRPQVQSSRNGFANGDDLRISDQSRKRDEYLSGPLPLVRLNPRSDWADDERDTGHGLIDRVRDHGHSKSESYWDGDFDMPKASFLVHKPAPNSLERWGQRDNDTVKSSTSDVHKSDTYHHGRDGRVASREGKEGNSWRSSSLLLKDSFSSQEPRSDRNGLVGRSSLPGTEVKKDSKYVSSTFRDGASDDFGRREFANGLGQQPWNRNSDSLGSRIAERSSRDRNSSEQYAKYNASSLQNNSALKSSFGNRGPPFNDPVLNFTRDIEKHNFTKSDKSYVEDSFLKDFGHGHDPLAGSLVGVVKRKKDAVKSVEVYDPVRESFEAELERVQKMQEQERKRIIEEQERALELARREEEERARLARELEEQRRRIEEEAREAERRAEQERLEALRQAEEQRIAREEEKQRILMEEERRKQAAKQKLLELEERIAKRRAGVAAAGNSSSDADGRVVGLLNEKDAMQVTEVGDWEDSEKMVERLTTSASSDSSSHNRPFDMASKPNFGQDNATQRERGKMSDTWRKDPFHVVNNSNFGFSEQESGYHGTRRDPSFGDRPLPRKEFYSASGYAASRNYHKGVLPEPQMDQLGAQRWNLGNGDSFNRSTEVDSEYHENFVERLGGDIGWGQGRSHANLYSPYSEQFPQIAEVDGSHSFGRSRYSMRQPRVLPPPSLASMHKNLYRGEIERPGPSAIQGNEMHYAAANRIESTMNMSFDSCHQEYADRDSMEIEPENTAEQNLDRKAAPRCDSQSSLSVSSPPDSPVHLSHDDLDECGDYPGKSSVEDREVLMSGNGAVLSPVSAGQENVDVSGSVFSGEEGEWSMENNELAQEQEEYDEDEECYQDEEEVRDGDEDNMDQNEEFDDIHVVNGSSPDNLVLGFDNGIEVLVPSDELERNPVSEPVDCAVPVSSNANVGTHDAFGGFGSHGKTEQQIDDSSKPTVDTSSRLLQETEKAMEQLVIVVDKGANKSTDSEALDNSEASGGSISARHASSNSLASHSSGNAVLPTAPAVSSQSEPVKLQFGLFSGPSLIPSPVPAIQIGSIQMPLHLHPQVVPSLNPLQQSQNPIFQFGQLRYTSQVSPGMIPLTPNSLPFFHSNGPVNFSFNQNQDGISTVQAGHESGQNSVRMDAGSHVVESHLGLMHNDNAFKNTSATPAIEKAENIMKLPQGGVEHSQTIGNNTLPSHHVQDQGRQNESSRNDRLTSSSRKWERQAFSGAMSTNLVRKEKDVNGSRGNGSINGGRVKHYVFKVKNAPSRSSVPDIEPSDADSSGYQRRPRRSVKRTEFRVRENGEKRRLGILGSPATIGLDDRTIVTGTSTSMSARNWSGKAIISNKLSKEISESDTITSSAVYTRESDSTGGNLVRSWKEPCGNGQLPHQSHLLEQQSKANAREEDIDAPLQSGVVRVFEQPGIEAPSDEDDFIEVRSKRQMLNDKREQREKEIKAKSRITKVPRKPRSLQNVGLSSGSKRTSSLRSGEALKSINTDGIVTDGRGMATPEIPAVKTQSLPPIGTPTVRNDAQADSLSQKIKSVRAGSHPVISKDIQSGLSFEGSDKVLDNVQSLDSWRNSGINLQVMQLTQSQLDEAMKSAEFDALASVGDHNITVSEPPMPSSSVLPKDKSFSSAVSPINSLLAGEKIQFGAVTSPTILPPSRHSVSHGICPPGPLSDIQMPHKLSTADDDCAIFFDKDKNSSDSCVQLEDCEAEAEAAASAVAVAAISSDEIVGNGLGGCSISISDTKTFGAADIGGISTGIAGDQRSTVQSKAEEPLNVSLPADLSVDTPPISLWQPMTSQTTSSQMLPHFPGGPPSHFPFYEMNTMIGSPIFAFGPNEESGSSQPQKSSAPSSGPHGSWQPGHSGLDSFYGPPAGFTGPFISPGGIHQGPPHMVVYNHFTPVGQFGPVGLSFMGTTFIPSGRQPDWKHNPASSPMVVEGDMKNVNVVTAQRNAANMPATIQHLAPGSPLLPMAPPVFDVSPFQSSPEMSVHARWPHIPTSQLQAASGAMPMQQQVGVLPQFSNGHSIDQQLNANRFVETRTSTPDSNLNFSSAADATANRLPDELALLDPSGSSAAVSIQNICAQTSSSNVSANAGNSDLQNNDDSNCCSPNTDATSFKIHSSQQKGGFLQNNVSSSNYNNQRGGTSQKGGEWAHRRGGFQGRNHSFGAERSFSSSKVKQIYVAKQTVSAKSAVS